MVVVGGDELAEGHSAVRLVTEEVDDLLSKLLGALHFIPSTLCGEAGSLVANILKVFIHFRQSIIRISPTERQRGFHKFIPLHLRAAHSTCNHFYRLAKKEKQTEFFSPSFCKKMYEADHTLNKE